MKKTKILVPIFFLIFVVLFSFQKEVSLESNLKDEVFFSYYIDDVITPTAPKKEDGKVFDAKASSCTNGASIRWNYEEWGAEILGGNTTKTKCYLRFKTEYQESILNGTTPVLKDELIPVVIEDDGTVKRADLSSEWYSYEKKRWANAIILKDESKIKLYKENEVIKEEEIESYFVWIPRYRYQIFNEGKYESLTANVVNNSIASEAKRIEVVFENKEVALSTGNTIGSWLTHPAFVSFDVNGMWVGKFETGNKGVESNVRNGDQVEIKPNVESWRNIQVSKAFYTSYDYKRNLESHLMKNTEWGAVAYLQHSKYGSETSVRHNNHSGNITGYAAKNEATCGYTGTNLECNRYCNDGSCNEPYNTSIGYLASTTGNISGIYDMSGGTWEMVMGLMLDQNGNLISGKNDTLNSGFVGSLTLSNSFLTFENGGVSLPDSKYFDTYNYGTSEVDFQRGLFGDATKEMGPFGNLTYDDKTGLATGDGKKTIWNISSWYQNFGNFIDIDFSWFNRGGNFSDGCNNGVFAFNKHYTAGAAHQARTFRVVLMPE